MLTNLLNALSTVASVAVAKSGSSAAYGQNNSVEVTIANLKGAY